MLKPGHFEPPLRRVLAVDAGSRCLRLLLLENRLGHLRVLEQDEMDLHEEGLVSPEEVRAHLRKALDDWGRPPVALALPQHIVVSQIVDLPPASESEVRSLIEAETLKLGGVSESTIVYDFVRVPSPDDARHHYWITFCQEVEIQGRIVQLGLEEEDFREITTVASALLTAWRINHPQTTDAILVHAGARSTTVVIAVDGAGVFAAAFPIGGDAFTRAIAKARNLPIGAAETLKRKEALLDGANRLAGLTQAVDEWATELKRQLNEWHGRQPGTGLKLSKFTLFASGGVFEQPGMLEYLQARAGLKFVHWPTDFAPEAALPTTGFEIALGAALQALGHSKQPVSLLPSERRVGWKKRLVRQRLEFASALVLAVVLCALAYGIWQKVSLIRHKRELLAKVEAGLASAQANAALTAELLAGFELLRPLFEGQQNTSDILQTISDLQIVRTNRSFWYVLLADQQSYFSGPRPPVATNKPSATPDLVRTDGYSTTNVSPAKPGCIAELCVPEDPDTARRVLSTVVGELKKDPVFARVDLLSEDLRRSLADPKVILPDKHFALALDFATAEFQRPTPMRKARPPAGSRLLPRPLQPETADEP